MKPGSLRLLLGMAQLVVLLGMQLAEGTGVHRCPEHDAGIGAVSGDEMNGHQGLGQAGHHPGHGQPAHAACHCVGPCSTVTAMHRAADAPAIALGPRRYAQPGSYDVVALRDTVRLLPFALGPPPTA